MKNTLLLFTSVIFFLSSNLVYASSDTIEIESIITLIIFCVIAFFWYMINVNGGFLNFIKNYKAAVKEEFKPNQKKNLRKNKKNKKTN